MKSPIKTVVHALSWVGEKIALVVTPIILTVFYLTHGFGLATTVAVLGTSRNRAISPNEAPGPIVGPRVSFALARAAGLSRAFLY